MKIFQKSQNVKVRMSRNRRSLNSLERLPQSQIRIFRLFKLTFAYAKSVILIQHLFYWNGVEFERLEIVQEFYRVSFDAIFDIRFVYHTIRKVKFLSKN